jgi:hypothetical protein
MSNLAEGGTYTLVITGSGTSSCTFNTTIGGTDGAGTVSYRFAPANGARIASSHTTYTMVRVNNIVYISWITGFQ